MPPAKLLVAGSSKTYHMRGCIGLWLSPEHTPTPPRQSEECIAVAQTAYGRGFDTPKPDSPASSSG